MKIQNSLIAAAATLVVSGNAFAGFTANTGVDPFAYSGAGISMAPAVGGTISVTNQPLQSYAPDTAADPQVLPGDIDNFLFSLNVTVNDVNLGAANSAGTYSVYYDLGDNGTPDIRVSEGTATLFLSPLGGGLFVATGQLNQVLGPANPAFADLAYGNNANFILEGGLYTGVGATDGTLTLVLRQNAVVPEPTTLAALAGASLLGLRRRRA